MAAKQWRREGGWSEMRNTWECAGLIFNPYLWKYWFCLAEFQLYTASLIFKSWWFTMRRIFR